MGNFHISHTWKNSPHQILSPPPLKRYQLPSYNSIKIKTLAVIAHATFLFNFIPFGHRGHADFFILIDAQYSQKAVFSFEKGLNGQSHSSSGSQHPVKKFAYHPPQNPLLTTSSFS